MICMYTYYICTEIEVDLFLLSVIKTYFQVCSSLLFVVRLAYPIKQDTYLYLH